MWPALALDRRPVLTTGRLTLSPPRMCDAEDLVRAVNDPAVVRWLARVPFPYTLDDAAYFLGQIAPAELNYLIRRTDTGALAGAIGLKPQSASAGELGYWLASAHWGEGIATEAARRLVDFALDELKLTRLTAFAALENTRSVKVLEKLGFVQSGRSLRHVLVLGREVPHIDFHLDAPATD